MGGISHICSRDTHDSQSSSHSCSHGQAHQSHTAPIVVAVVGRVSGDTSLFLYLNTTSTTNTMCGSYYGGCGYGGCGYGGLGCGYGSSYGCGFGRLGYGSGCGSGCGYGYRSHSLCGCGYGCGYGSGFGWY
ncbi:keratin-associated protein 6-1-like [Canis lupus familiaris]|uniref:keratin-associated protein 6-1-like n=1 Tax=Canis lupus familiaris TaxID=9615 RepID=UPI0002257429|nr:keratin-associated protein 6-1-like [Canis lupus familiaris]XP_038299697.1 keratin-associated protein 6-1-like [Canis lupus familiaris]XP_038437659.1 keratin-associated protein 6-1-like [Canis lupus familiaris]|eukprot:XP_022268782.1 keratin-associated protein 6-1-like [Canis lupus familiaris]